VRTRRETPPNRDAAVTEAADTYGFCWMPAIEDFMSAKGAARERRGSQLGRQDSGGSTGSDGRTTKVLAVED
jgi:hypothetical protein